MSNILTRCGKKRLNSSRETSSIDENEEGPDTRKKTKHLRKTVKKALDSSKESSIDEYEEFSACHVLTRAAKKALESSKESSIDEISETSGSNEEIVKKSKKVKVTKQHSKEYSFEEKHSDFINPHTENVRLFDKFNKNRFELYPNGILEFPFNNKRIRMLSKSNSVKKGCEGILYWMNRDQRVQDNWAFLFAQKLALKNKVPLHICFCLLVKDTDTVRHLKFLLSGLEDVHNECKNLKINFKLLFGYPGEKIFNFVQEEHIGAVVCDFSPLRHFKEAVEIIQNILPEDIAFVQIDAHNIVPVWEASDKQEYAAKTIRNKINSKLTDFLTEFPPVILHPFEYKGNCARISWKTILKQFTFNKQVKPVKWANPGYESACRMLYNFCETRLEYFADCRNNPPENYVSNLSPWFHFGHISCQRAILYIKQFQSKFPHSVDVFCEEAIVRRELADNFCFYNENYDNLSGISDWAKKTLQDHSNDPRNPLYTLDELETAKSYDDLWNSAQIQLVEEGKMHGYLRMYWAKKILEWTESPKLALETAIYLNDKYSLDGSDPNGYVGCMWSIGGIHDQGWGERPIFGKIRYMNYKGCKKWFNIPDFVKIYGGKVYEKGI